VKKVAALPKGQLARLDGPTVAEIMIDKVSGWRAMHAHGRALNGLVRRAAENSHQPDGDSSLTCG
jgi:hypothetical protein